MRRLTSHLALALLLNVCAATGALAAEWQVARVSGVVWVVVANRAPVRATVGMVLPDNATVGTSSQGRALLRHDQDILNVGPNTQIAPQARPVKGLTTVLMRTGEVELEIEHRQTPHFAVQTPYLAAVVKGTHFSVVVTDTGADVRVASGRVHVNALGKRGQSVDITNGQSANVDASGMSTSGPGAPAASATETQASPVVEGVAGSTAATEAATDIGNGNIGSVGGDIETASVNTGSGDNSGPGSRSRGAGSGSNSGDSSSSQGSGSGTHGNASSHGNAGHHSGGHGRFRWRHNNFFNANNGPGGNNSFGGNGYGYGGFGRGHFQFNDHGHGRHGHGHGSH